MNEQIRLIDRDKLWELFVKHYWDSISKDRDIILTHINSVMLMIKDQNQWRDISTAPKDESWIITYTPRGYYKGVHMNRWSEKDNTWYKDNNIDLPTHWQPLPEPPKE